MFSFLIISVILILVTGLETINIPTPNSYISQEIFSQIQSKAKTWQPLEPSKNPFSTWSDLDIKKMLGGLKQHEGGLLSKLLSFRAPTIKKAAHSHKDEQKTTEKLYLPNSFDARNQWPNCIHPVRSQGSCGSCWAFSTAGFLEDRFCIASNGAITTQLSPQDMISCDLSNGACEGGYLTPSLYYAITQGLVADACMPYQAQGSFCAYQCQDPSISFQKYGCQEDSIKILTNYDDIKQELVTNGPMMVGFVVYTDFMSYSNGIYEYTYGTVQGGHAVKLIGWDYDGNGRMFWICQNQWGSNWGESGFFQIYSGQVGLDSAVYSCSPDLTSQ